MRVWMLLHPAIDGRAPLSPYNEELSCPSDDSVQVEKPSSPEPLPTLLVGASLTPAGEEPS